MKSLHLTFSLFILPLFISSCGHAQVNGSKQEHLWSSDYNAAIEKAQETGRYVLVDFTGSDWCGWCIKLVNEVFSKAEFNDFAAVNLINVEIDFPRDKEISEATLKQNEALAEKYSIRGFPTILIISPEGELVEQTGYRQGGAKEYVEHLKGIIAKHKEG